MGKDGYYGDFAPDQTSAENGGAKSQPRKMSRIDAPVTKSITGEGQLDDDATDNSVAIGKQMEMEAGNAIKYRTCSWQKVSFLVMFLFAVVPRRAFAQSRLRDGGQVFLSRASAMIC